jgi:hypothetical protein
MSARFRSRCWGAVALGLVLAGCGPTKPRKADTAAIVFEQSKGALASRLECQTALDAARAALARKNANACITSLAEAVAFFRNEAQAAPSEAQAALLATAEELETLLANVANGRRRTPRDFDRAFARAHAAEATHHLALARVAILKDEHVRAGEQLFMSVDHLERAAKDARMRDDRRVETAVADTRTLASEMIRGMAAVPDESNKVTAEIERAVSRIVESVYVPPGPALPPR